MARAFIAIGSNIEPKYNVREALRLLAREVTIVKTSTVYLTEALGRPDEPPYYNCVVEIATDMPPLKLKSSVLRRVEAALGRKRSEDRYASRTIDLDLILYNGVTLNTRELTIPDPEISERPFIALPLSEIDPALTISGRPIAEIAAQFATERLQPLSEFTEYLRRRSYHGEEKSKVSRYHDP